MSSTLGTLEDEYERACERARAAQRRHDLAMENKDTDPEEWRSARAAAAYWNQEEERLLSLITRDKSL